MIHFLSLIVLGFALQWSLRLVYGRQRRVLTRDPLILVLTQTSWILVFLGVGIAFGPIMIVAVLTVSGMIIARYRYSERRALLWSLSVAAERGISLSEAARAFAAGRIDEIGHRAEELAACLDQGMPLPNALIASGNPLPYDAELAARMGFATDSLSVTLRDAARDGDRFATITYANYGTILYAVIVINFMVGMFAFAMTSLVPTYRQIMNDFDVALPAITRFTFSAAHMCAKYSFVFAPFLLLSYVLLIYTLLGYLGIRLPALPLPRSLFPRIDSALILRSLGTSVRQQRPMLQSIELLAHWHPQRAAGAKLAKAASAIRSGQHWCDSMLSEKLISVSDAAVLRSAERVGNLDWACHELSDANSRRASYRAAAVSRGLGPLLALVMGVPVALFAFAMISPMTLLIHRLAL